MVFSCAHLAQASAFVTRFFRFAVSETGSLRPFDGLTRTLRHSLSLSRGITSNMLVRVLPDLQGERFGRSGTSACLSDVRKTMCILPKIFACLILVPLLTFYK